jgi:hypothetical protein
LNLIFNRFFPPANFNEVDVLKEAYRLRLERADPNINEEHLAHAIENLISNSNK